MTEVNAINTITPDTTAYLPYADSGTLAGVYEDFEYQVRTIGAANSLGAPLATGFVKNLCITAIKVVK